MHYVVNTYARIHTCRTQTRTGTHCLEGLQCLHCVTDTGGRALHQLHFAACLLALVQLVGEVVELLLLAAMNAVYVSHYLGAVSGICVSCINATP